MPNYTLKNTNTDEKYVQEFPTSEVKDAYLKENPHIKQLLTNISIVSPYSVGRRTTDNSFRTVMKHINSTTHGANVNSGNLSEV